MRLFAALELSDAVRSGLAAWWEDAGALLDTDDWRDVPARNWHLTLAFFGDVDGQDMPEIADALGECAAHVQPLDLRTAGMGMFPSPKKPRVFWAGIDEAGERNDLMRLARCCRHAGHATVRKRDDGRGREKESPFRGHVTLARAREPFSPMDMNLLRKMPPVPEIDWRADVLGLYQSVLKPEGARYHLLEAIELKNWRGNEHVR